MMQNIVIVKLVTVPEVSLKILKFKIANIKDGTFMQDR